VWLTEKPKAQWARESKPHCATRTRGPIAVTLESLAGDTTKGLADGGVFRRICEPAPYCSSRALGYARPIAPLSKLTITDLRTKAFEKGVRGVRSSAAGVTYAQAAERALENAGGDDVEQLVRWWVMEKLDAGMFVGAEWSGEVSDLPLEVPREVAIGVVTRAREIWTHVIFNAFQEGLREADDES